MQNNEPAWLIEAKKHEGVAEIPGPASNAWINAMWLALPGGAWFWKTYKADDSKLPWCGAFIAYCMQACGLSFPKLYASAKAWTGWGSKLSAPIVGCIVVFERPGGGHVGLVVGRTASGNLMVLGGNQRDGVRVSEFSRDRVVGYYWPAEVPLPIYTALIMLPSTGEISRNEA